MIYYFKQNKVCFCAYVPVKILFKGEVHVGSISSQSPLVYPPPNYGSGAFKGRAPGRICGVGGGGGM